MTRVENVRWRACTVAGINIAKGCDGNSVKNSIVGWITAATPNNTIENCDVYDTEPYRDLASKAKAEKNGCFTADPQFVDEKNLNYSLKPKSPCRGKASDGGNLGFHYTPELIELMKEAIRLRDKGVVKF